MAASSVTLSMDILVEEILPRLPVKSLLRFKCVSKFFKTLISTPEFAHRHLHRSLSSGANRVLFVIENEGDLFTFHLYLPEVPAFSVCFPDDINNFSDGRIFLVGSTHGLACVCTSFSSLIMFNPSTGIYRQIYSGNLSPRRSCTTYGFGFDDVKRDYKVVRVTLHDLDNDDNDDPYYVEVWREVQVYSLNSDSWSLIETTSSIQDSMEPLEHSVLIDNHLVHWIFRNLSNDEHRIGCFDLRNNRWTDDVPLPDFCPEDGTSTGGHSTDVGFHAYRKKQIALRHLGVLCGCLGLLTMDFERRRHDVWVMKEYGVKASWVKLADIPDITSPEWLKFSPFFGGSGSRSENLREVDLQSKLAKKLRRIKTVGLGHYSEACLCNGSLVSIPGGLYCQIQALKDNVGCKRNDLKCRAGSSESGGNVC